MEEKQKPVNNTEIIEKLSDNLIKFLDSLTIFNGPLNNNFKTEFKLMKQLTPIQKLTFIKINVKPHEIDLDGLLEHGLAKYNIKRADLKKEDFTKLLRYMKAMCELI